MSVKWYEMGPFTIFDLETTGMSPSRDRIVEIAAVHVDKNGVQNRFHTLVNPRRPIPLPASKVHKITDKMVAEAPVFAAVANPFLDFARGSTLVAHNARFDLGFLQESFHRTGSQLWRGKTLDSIPIIKSAFNGLPSYSLGYLREYFGLGSGSADEKAHRACTDVEWTLEIFEMAMTALIKASG